jgi:hypothetical protein
MTCLLALRQIIQFLKNKENYVCLKDAGRNSASALMSFLVIAEQKVSHSPIHVLEHHTTNSVQQDE